MLGIGHELRGDDAAGLQAARRLQELASGQPDRLILETGPVPENFTGSLRRFAPDLVILVDAALMGEPAGAVRWLDWRDTGGFSSSTHSLPLSTFCDYLVSELGCEVRLLGIQPGANELDTPLSPAMVRGVQRAVEILEEILWIHPPTRAVL